MATITVEEYYKKYHQWLEKRSAVDSAAIMRFKEYIESFLTSNAADELICTICGSKLLSRCNEKYEVLDDCADFFWFKWPSTQCHMAATGVYELDLCSKCTIFENPRDCQSLEATALFVVIREKDGEFVTFSLHPRTAYFKRYVKAPPSTPALLPAPVPYEEEEEEGEYEEEEEEEYEEEEEEYEEEGEEGEE